MSTPLRLLVSPRCKSLSPVYLSKSCGTPKIRPRNHTAARRLDFAVSPFAHNGTTTKCSVPEILVTEPRHTTKHKCLTVNTPQKNNLLKCGLENRNVCHVIGAGSFGTVIEGFYKGENVAMKITKPTPQIPEAKVLGLMHDNIIKTLDVLSGNGFNYCIVVMEYFKSSVALSFLLESKPSFTRVLNIAKDVCSGLVYLHENDILHLDIKPANILVCPDGVCKLCDFGSCMKVGESYDIFRYKGTVMYTAPEILVGKLPTSKSDVYSLGILMWQLVTSKTPFSNFDNGEVLIYNVVKFGLRPDVGQCGRGEYQDLFCSCWNAEPSVRPEVAEVLANLQQMKCEDVQVV